MTTHHDITVDGTRIHYRLIGEGQDLVVLQHGWMVSSAIWDDFIPLLDAAGRTFVVPDMRGTGRSDVPPADGGHYTLAALTRDLAAVVDDAMKQRGTDRFRVVGHSMGGQLALWLAATRGAACTGTVAVTPVPLSGIPLPDDARGLFSTSGGDRGKQQTILGLACKTLEDGDRDRLLKDAGAIAPHVIAEVFASWSGGFADGDDVSLQRAPGPVMVLATDDAFTPPPFMQQAIVSHAARGRLVHLAGPGHYPQVEAPTSLSAAINAFLAAG